MCQWLTSTLENSCGCTALDVAKRTATAGQIDWREKRPSQVACVSKDLKRCLGSLVHYLRAQSRGRHTTDRLEERGVGRGSARRSSLKRHETAIVNQTLELFQRQRRVDFCERELSAYGLLRAHRYHLELCWNDLSLSRIVSDKYRHN